MRVKKLLSEEQYDFLQRYMELMEVVEEGFVLLQECYMERNYGQGDQLLINMTEAFAQFNAFNMTMSSIFIEDREIIDQLEQFQSILKKVSELGEHSIQVEENKVGIVTQELSTCYTVWKITMEKNLEKYHIQ